MPDDDEEEIKQNRLCMMAKVAKMSDKLKGTDYLNEYVALGQYYERRAESRR